MSKQSMYALLVGIHWPHRRNRVGLSMLLTYFLDFMIERMYAICIENIDTDCLITWLYIGSPFSSSFFLMS
jgi:hypothetical protein